MSKKKYLVKVPLSCTSLIKSRCKYCKSVPIYTFIKVNCIPFKDFYNNKQSYSMYRKHINNFICYDYKHTSPSLYNKINIFSYNFLFNRINIRHNKNYGWNMNYSNIIDNLTCSCGKTVWLFNKTNGLSNEFISQKRLKDNYQKVVIY